MSWRIRSVRKKILLLALFPMLSLFALYVFTTSLTARDALHLAQARTLKNATGQPVGDFLGQVDTERQFAAIYLSAPVSANLARLKAEEKATGRTTAVLRAALTAGSTRSNDTAGERRAIGALLKDSAGLPALRAQIAARNISRSQAISSYNTVVADAYQLLSQVILQENNAHIAAQALALVRMGKAGELLQQESLILVSDLVGRKFPVGDQRAFTQLAGARKAQYRQTLADLDPAYRARYARGVSPAALAALTSLENRVIGGSTPGGLPAVSPQAWQRAAGAVSLGLQRAGAQAAEALNQRAVSEARATDLRLVLSGGAGLAAVILSIIISVLVGRGLVRELAALRSSALELADNRLPKLVSDLSEGLDVTPPPDALAVPVKSDEIRQVRDAFAKVQRTAVQAAIGQARLREGISEVFRNLARRSQSLLHRQLALLDGMERRAKDPQELEDLFRIDHLTTRMRRHAESLIILSGQAPARGWRNPVPLVDVLRAAVAEVEDYPRVRVVCSADAALAGPAVGDVIHMIAEIVENAAIFSPPNAPVVVNGDIVGQGFVVEVEDRGLGLSEHRLAEINDRLANPPPFDPASTDQLGLFVASQLAERHDIRITLRPNPYGGITAIILIPHSVVVPERIASGEPAKALESAAQGRHATQDGNGAQSAGTQPTDPAEPGPRRSGLAGISERPTAGAWPPKSRVSPVSPPDLRFPPDPAYPAAGGHAGPAPLPRRIRQASLAPQLRDGGGIPLSAPPPGPPAPRSPEDVRATMASMQQGWERGRSLFEPAHPGRGDPPPPGPGPAGQAGPGTAPQPGFAAGAPASAGSSGASGAGPGFGPPPPAGFPPPAPGMGGPAAHGSGGPPAEFGVHGDGPDGGEGAAGRDPAADQHEAASDAGGTSGRS